MLVVRLAVIETSPAPTAPAGTTGRPRTWPGPSVTGPRTGVAAVVVAVSVVVVVGPN